MRMRKICLIVMSVAVMLCVFSAIVFLAYISPKKDAVDSFDYPPDFFAKQKKIISIIRPTENARLMPQHIFCGTSGKRRTEKHCFWDLDDRLASLPQTVSRMFCGGMGMRQKPATEALIH